MAHGYMGEILNVDLTTGQIEAETLDETLCRDYIGGYGLGAKLLYDRMPAHADPLGPDNILGILTGPLTGTPALIGSRFVVFAKSPKTQTWGDANCGGYFGPHLKFAGYDGILVKGIASKPVYLLIEEGEASLHDASDLWGKNVSEMEDILMARHGNDIQVMSIGPAGEKKSLLACIMNDRERAAGRSGLGAVMGSKNLKAVVVRGRMSVPVDDPKKINAMRRDVLRQKTGFYDILHTWGTAGITHDSALSGDSPVKNWGGAGTVDFPSEKARRISDDAVISVQQYKAYACYGCPIGCGGKMRQDKGEFALALNDGIGHKPEYETLCMSGTNLLNDSLPSIAKYNEICNAYGLDTISVGATLGYVIECYENGLLKKEQLDGMEMRWGNAKAIVAMTEKIGKREGVGDILADGVKVAWEKLGKIGTEYAIHVAGEELPAHDPRFTPGLATTYVISATPGRHTQGGELLPPPGLELEPRDKYTYTGHAANHLKLVTTMDVCNAAGLCMFGYLSYPVQSIPDQLKAVTGWDFTLDEVYKAGERIYTMRHLFNLREGHNPLTRNVPGRMIGKPPLKEGNVKGVTVDIKALNDEFLTRLDWDTHTTIPSEARLRQLGMDFAVADRAGWSVPAVS
ncbi:MAG TPA: aldehyde ferredoxin oxidoreductase family protein [Anaerolineae bacterium]|nr:aldehyde ferredoxin oxidoreductase family protein [Anaerolineae bacterium]